jgi:hypothetical protein
MLLCAQHYKQIAKDFWNLKFLMEIVRHILDIQAGISILKWLMKLIVMGLIFHRLEGMSELGGEFLQVEQVATYVTFLGGCVTLPELCRNFA